jgi:hypothetical protein
MRWQWRLVLDCSRIVVVKVDVDWTHGAGHMQASHQVTPEEGRMRLSPTSTRSGLTRIRTASLGAACG